MNMPLYILVQSAQSGDKKAAMDIIEKFTPLIKKYSSNSAELRLYGVII
jgi:hypothetical protein